MSNLSLDKLNIAAAPPERTAPPLQLIDVRIDTPTFGDHLTRVSNRPEKPERPGKPEPQNKPEPVRDADDTDRTRDDREAADEAPAAEYRSENHNEPEQDANEAPPNEDPNERVTDSEAAPSDEDAIRGDEPSPEDAGADETQVTVTNDSGQEVDPTASLPKVTDTVPIDEEQPAKETVKDESLEKSVVRRGAEGLSDPADGAKTKTSAKAAAGDQPPVDTNGEQLAGEDNVRRPVDDAAGDTSKGKRSEELIPAKQIKKEDNTAVPSTPKEAKAEEAGNVAQPAPDGEGETEGRKQPGKRGRREVRHLETSQPNQNRAPATASSAQASDNSASVEKPAAVAELDQTVERTSTKEGTPETATVRVGGQQQTSAAVVESPPTTQQRIAQELDSLGTAQTARTNGQSDAERVRFVQRVARAFHAAGEQGGRVTLRLNPPELGSVRLEVTIRDGALRAQLETETATARHALLENLPALRERLAEQNVRIEQFDVDLRDDGRGSDPETRTGDRQEPGDRRPREERTGRTSIVGSEGKTSAEPAPPTTDNGLNVIV